MMLLAKLMPTIMILDVRVPSSINEGEITAILPAIATLSHLRKLHVYLDETLPILAADLRALRSLTQLQELTLATGDCDDAADADLAALLGPLGGLRKLVLYTNMPQLTPLALIIVGKKLPLLRHMTLYGTWSLLAPLETAKTSPLFPSLGYFCLSTDIDETASAYSR